MERRALRLGLRPGEWERFSPAEVSAMEEAERWRHRRAAGMLAVAVCSLGNRIPLHDEAMDFASIRKALELYEPED